MSCKHEAWECTGGWHTCTDCRRGLGSRGSESIAAGHWPYDCEICSESNSDTIKSSSGTGGYVTKDSGKREEYDSGMVRDTQDGKPRFDLLVPRDVPYSDQFLTRVAGLLGRGAEKYSDRNWEKAGGNEELERFKSSAFRHFFQWLNDESDEDHAAAVVFNLLAYETIKWKLDNNE